MFKYFIKEFKEDDPQMFKHIIPYHPNDDLVTDASCIIIASADGVNETWAVEQEKQGLEELRKYYDDVIYNVKYLVCYPTEITT